MTDRTGSPDADTNDPALIAPFQQAQRQFEEQMGNLDRAFTELVEDLQNPTYPVTPAFSVAATIACASQLALTHARDTASLLFGDDLTDAAAAPATAEWTALRDRLPGLGIDLDTAVDDPNAFADQVVTATTHILASFLAAGVVCGRIETGTWPLQALTQLIVEQVVQASLGYQTSEQAEDFLRGQADH